MELSTIIGKQILSPSGETLGYVKHAYLTRDCAKLSSFACINAEEEEFYLPFRTVSSIDDAVIAGRMRQAEPTGIPCPIGATAYTNLGVSLGVVCDYLFGEGTEPLFVLCKEGVRTPCEVDCVSVGKSVIVYPDASSRKRCAPRKKPSGEKQTPTIQSEQKPETVHTSEPEARGAYLAEENNSDRSAGYRLNLLGKQVKKGVYDEQGFPIVHAGERITPEVLLNARRNNRLLQLTVNTLTNIW